MKKSDLIPYINITTNYNVSGWYDVEPNCNGYMITNTGDVAATVNDSPYYPGTIGTNLGDSKTFGGNEGEVTKTRIKISFAVPPVGTRPNIEIVQKVYVNLID